MSEQDDTISQETTNASKTQKAQGALDAEVALEIRTIGGALVLYTREMKRVLPVTV